MALTASATPSVQKDVADQLGLKSYVLLSQSFNRANLRYTVRGKPSNTTKAAIQYIQNEHPKQCGVIYCNGRDKCEKVASDLRGQGIKAMHFHAKMTEKDKRHVLQSWKNGHTDVIVGTVRCNLSPRPWVNSLAKSTTDRVWHGHQSREW